MRVVATSKPERQAFCIVSAFLLEHVGARPSYLFARLGRRPSDLSCLLGSPLAYPFIVVLVFASGSHIFVVRVSVTFFVTRSCHVSFLPYSLGEFGCPWGALRASNQRGRLMSVPGF
jgi:hypothetical protein